MLLIITNTKALIMPTCKICKQKFKAERFNQKNCSNHDYKELAEWAKNERNKKDEIKRKKTHNIRKKAFYADDLKTRKTAAKKACHDYIRLRDVGLPCICCGRVLGDNYHAGHFLESGNNPKIRYDEDNIHGQSIYCNTYQGGNSDDYEGRLRVKIGDERVDRLKALKSGTMKRTAQDYKAIEDYYKEKIKML